MERYRERTTNRDNVGHNSENSAEERRDIIIRGRRELMEALVRQMDNLNNRVNQRVAHLQENVQTELATREVQLEKLNEHYSAEAIRAAQSYIHGLAGSNSESQPLQGDALRVLDAIHEIIRNSQENIAHLRQGHQHAVSPLNSEIRRLEEQYMEYEEEISHIIDAFREKTPTPDPDDDVLRWRR
jgi:hypothetical protein